MSSRWHCSVQALAADDDSLARQLGTTPSTLRSPAESTILAYVGSSNCGTSAGSREVRWAVVSAWSHHRNAADSAHSLSHLQTGGRRHTNVGGNTDINVHTAAASVARRILAGLLRPDCLLSAGGAVALEPLLRERCGTGANFCLHLAEVGEANTGKKQKAQRKRHALHGWDLGLLHSRFVRCALVRLI